MKKDGPVKDMSTADRILAVATKHFLSHGVYGSNIDKIAAEAGVGKNSIYALYENKAALFKIVVQNTVLHANARIENIGSSSQQSEYALREHANRFLHAFVNQEIRSLYRAIVSVENPFPLLGTNLKDQWQAAAKQLEARFRSINRLHSAVPIDHPRLSEEFAAVLASGARYLMGHGLPNADDRDFIAVRTVELFLHGHAVAQRRSAAPGTESPGFSQKAAESSGVGQKQAAGLAGSDKKQAAGAVGSDKKQAAEAAGAGLAAASKSLGSGHKAPGSGQRSLGAGHTIAALFAPLGDRPQMRLAPARAARMLDLMTREFLDQGFEGASVEKVLAETRISKATIYRQFGSKANLFTYAVTRLAEATWPGALPAPLPGKTPTETLALVAMQILDLHLSQDSIALQRLMIAEAIGFPELAVAVHQRLLAAPTQLLQDALAAHALPLADEASAQAFFVLATSGMRWIANEHRPDAEDRADTCRRCAEIFYRGIAAAPAEDHYPQTATAE